MQEKKPRENLLKFQVAETTTVAGFRYNPTDGTLQLINKAGDVVPLKQTSVMVTYQGEKRRRVLVQAPTDSSSIDPNRNLLRYQAVIGVDTNTSVIGDTRVSVATATYCQCEPHEKGVAFGFAEMGSVEMHGIAGDPEPLAWRFACEDMVRQVQVREGEFEVGLVVDSSLGALPDYNDRRRPVVDDWFLPRGFTLIYASDRAAESIANLLIRRCDRRSAAILDRVKAGDTGGRPLLTARSARFSQFRIWPPEDSGLSSLEASPTTA